VSNLSTGKPRVSSGLLVAISLKAPPTAPFQIELLAQRSAASSRRKSAGSPSIISSRGNEHRNSRCEADRSSKKKATSASTLPHSRNSFGLRRQNA
jgi:hypothetical protein